MNSSDVNNVHAATTAGLLFNVDRLRAFLHPKEGASSSPLTVLLDRSHGWSLDPTSNVVGGSSGPGDPTGNRVAATVDCPQCRHASIRAGSCITRGCGFHKPDDEHLYQILRSRIETANEVLSDIAAMLVKHGPLSASQAHRLYLELTGTQANRATECACVHCDDHAITDSIHCDACRRWLSVHPDMRQVPTHVIRARLRKQKEREVRRVHITGPLVPDDGAA